MIPVVRGVEEGRGVVAFVDWSNELSIGIPEIDAEHQNLVAILNELDEATHAGKGTRIMGQILERLLDYTETHFNSEEALMVASEYPGLALHRLQHRQLTGKAVKLRQKFVGSNQRITREMMEFLKYWLSNHILVDDKAFGAFQTGAASRPEMTQST